MPEGPHEDPAESLDDTVMIPKASELRGVPLSAIIARFNLEVVTDGGVDLTAPTILSAGLNRPGLQWAGYADHFPSARIQVIGSTEINYLASLPEDERWALLGSSFQKGVPAVILTRGMPVHERALRLAQENGVPVLRTPSASTDFSIGLYGYLALELAPRTLLHAGLVDVAGEGVLILGPSGIGKSETALELIRRGHRLIADDTVEARRPSEHELMGRAPGLMRHFMEIKGIGIVNLRTMYGVGSVKASGSISMAVSLERQGTGPSADQTGSAADSGADAMELTAGLETTSILGVKVPLLRIPVHPSRSTAILIESGAMAMRASRLRGDAPGLESSAVADLYGSIA